MDILWNNTILENASFCVITSHVSCKGNLFDFAKQVILSACPRM